MPVLTLEPQLAAWIDEAAPAVAHGGEATIRAKAVGGSARWMLLKYDISGVGATWIIIDAVIRLYHTGVGPAAAHLAVYRATAAWNEAVTWATKPAVFADPRAIASKEHPKVNTWEDFKIDWEGYDARHDTATGGSPRYWMQRQVKRWVDATDPNHGIVLYATNGVGAAEWVAVGRTGTGNLVPVLEITYATVDTLPASAGGDRKTFVGDALATLNASVVKDVDFSVTLELAAGDLDVTEDLHASPTLRRKLPFLNEKLDLGSFNFQLSNEDGKYSPTNRDSELWLHRYVGRDVVVEATVKGQTVTLYRGIITDAVQHGDKRVEILTTPKARRELDYPLETAMEDYSLDPYWRSTIASQNPADLYYNALHNYVGYADTKFNMASFVDAKTEWTAQGLEVHATWEGDSAWVELGHLQRATLGALYQDFEGRWALRVWKPTTPTAVPLLRAENFRWREDIKSIRNSVIVPWKWVFNIPWSLDRKTIEEEVTVIDADSIGIWGLRNLDVDQFYIRTSEAADLVARLYEQALSDPVYKGGASGSIGWMQHDLGDAVGLVGEDESIDETCIVTQQEIDIKTRSVRLRFLKSNWGLPRRDWVNTLNWYTGAIAESYTAGLASPVASSVVGPTLRDDGSMDITIGWTYDPNPAMPHEGFAVFINLGTAAPAVPTVASHDIVQFLDGANRSYQLGGVAANMHVTFVVAAYRGHFSKPHFGTLVGSAAAPDWTDLTLDGAIVAASVPTNVPVFAAGAAAQQEDGSTVYTITWTYAQGATEAEGFLLIANYGDAAPGLPSLAAHESERHLGPDARTTQLLGAKATNFGSFGLLAWRRTDEGIAYTALVTNAGWTNLQASATIDIDTTVRISAIEPACAPRTGAITKVIRLVGADFLPDVSTRPYDLTGLVGGVVMPLGVNNVVMYARLPVPVGCTLTQITARLQKNAALDIAQVTVHRITGDAVAVQIAAATLGVAGGVWTDVVAAAINELIGAVNRYTLAITLQPLVAATDAQFGWVEVTYTMPEFQASI